MLLHWLQPLVPYRIRRMVVPKGKLKTIKQGTLPSLFSICLNRLSKGAIRSSPVSIFHVALSLVPRAEDKSTYSNVRKEGWWLTNSTATDPSSSLLLFHYCSEGKKQGVKSYILNASGFTDPNPRNTKLQGFNGHVVNTFRGRTSGDPQARMPETSPCIFQMKISLDLRYTMNGICLLFHIDVVL